MPRGGPRVGSGPKPTVKLAAIDGGLSPLADPPGDLPEAQQVFWRSYAPAAIAVGTLTSQTEAAWRLLCEIDARRVKLLAQIEEQGETYMSYKTSADGSQYPEIKKHPLSAEYRGLAQRTESMMGRFGIAPFGKPVGQGKPKKAATSPWAQVAGFGK